MTSKQVKVQVRVETSNEVLTLSEVREAIRNGKHVYHVSDYGCPVRLFSAKLTHSGNGITGIDKDGLWYPLHKELV